MATFEISQNSFRSWCASTPSKTQGVPTREPDVVTLVAEARAEMVVPTGRR
jgi:hypothetical protein